MMSPQARWEYMKTVHERYREAKDKRAKGLILDEFTKTYGCHRKSALRLLNGPAPGLQRPRRAARGSIYDSPRLMRMLEAIWEASDYAWGQRLKEIIPDWLPSIRNRYQPTAEEERLLLSMSGPTIDRKLRARKQSVRKRIYGGTRPGRLLKHHIPIKTDSWDVDQPGYAEVDLVSHSGDCAEGVFAYTLNLTDVFSGWVERRCVLGKGQIGVQQAIDSIRQDLPFQLLGIDSDNGSEFINDHLWQYCQGDPEQARASVQFTRGRPYKKDDNAHIEQKNWTHVRKLLGYGRFDTREALAAINELYRGELRWFQNLLLPSQRLIEKTQRGSKLRRRYDRPRTPWARVVGSGHGDPARLTELQTLRTQINPFVISASVDRQIERIWNLRSASPKPAWLKPGRLPNYRAGKVPWPRPAPQTPREIERCQKLLRHETRLETW